MAQISSKIAPFPGCLDKRVVSGAPGHHDPTQELRAYIESLQKDSRDAQLQQEAVEENRDRLAEEVHRLQLEVEAANQTRQDMRALITERDQLVAESEKHQMLLLEVRRKADGAERQRAQVESQRDQAIRLYKESRKEMDQHIASKDEAVRQRDAAHRQRSQSVHEQEELASRLADAQRQHGEVQRALVEAQTGASKKTEAEIQKQILSIRQARDSAAAQSAELKIRISELEDAVANLTYDREVSDKTTKKAMVELQTLRASAEADAEKLQMLETLQAELAEVGQELTSLREQHASLQGAKEQMVAQSREYRETHEAMLISHTTQKESTMKERDVLRARLQERETELREVRAELAAAWAGAMQVTEPEIERLTKELEGMRSKAGSVNAMIQRFEEVSREREAMRLQVIELNAQLENARRDIKEIGALLAEARLQLKLSGKAGVPMLSATRASSAPRASETSARGQGPIGQLPTSEHRIVSMRAARERWENEPDSREALYELAKEAAAYSGGSEAAGQITLHRVASKLATWLESMLETNTAATGRNRRLIAQAIEFLSRIEPDSDLDSIRLTEVRVCVVDDSVEICESISAILGDAGFSVECAQHPSGALAMLAGQRYDLILLDVRLPEIDGFELCGYIREMEQHVSTPIVFVTGTEPEMEGESLAGAEFIGKPFHSGELALRALMVVINAQLQPA